MWKSFIIKLANWAQRGITIKEMVLTISVYKTMYQFCHPMPGEAGEMSESAFMPIPMD